MKRPLTERELRVLKMVCDGMTYKESANAMGVTIQCISDYMQRIYRNLDIQGLGIAKLVRWAIKNGVVKM